MEERDVLGRIDELVAEEHDLRARSRHGEGLSDDDRARLHDVEVALDQCWDLLRQRRARAETGADPDEAGVRDPTTVEHYQQ